MKSSFLLLLSLLPFIAVSQNLVVINGDAGKKNSEFNFYYTDEVAIGHPLLSINRIETVAIQHPVLFIEADSYQSCYLVNPGDTILLTKEKGLTKVVRTNKKYTAGQQDEFMFFYRLIHEIGNLRSPFTCPPEFKVVSDQVEREKRIRANYRKRLDYLNHYAVRYKLSSAFVRYCKSTFSGILVKELLVLCRDTETIRAISVKEYGHDFERLKKDLLPDPLVINHTEYHQALIPLSYLLTNAIDFKNYILVSNLISEKFESGDREFLLANRLITLLKFTKITPLKASQYYQHYLLLAKSAFYKEKVGEYYKEYQRIKAASTNQETVLSDVKDSKITWKTLVSRYKGSLVYVDLWASWCAPCKAEMPASELLRTDYKHKAVTFIYLSLDEKRTDWVNSANSLKLPVENSFVIQGAFDAKLIRDLKIRSIPRYLIIDQEGHIVNYDAPRPGDIKLKQQLNQLLNKSR